MLQVVASINPNCPENECSNFTLVHIQSRGLSDVLHHFWTMEKVPTFFYARTDINTTVNINWDLLLSENRSGSIQFSAKPLYSAAVCLTKVQSSDLLMLFHFHNGAFFNLYSL